MQVITYQYSCWILNHSEFGPFPASSLTACNRLYTCIISQIKTKCLHLSDKTFVCARSPLNSIQHIYPTQFSVYRNGWFCISFSVFILNAENRKIRVPKRKKITGLKGIEFSCLFLFYKKFAIDGILFYYLWFVLFMTLISPW